MIRPLFKAVPIGIVATSVIAAPPKYPNLVGKTRMQIIDYCSSNTKRMPHSNEIMIGHELCTYYFKSANEIPKNLTVMNARSWKIDFRSKWYSKRTWQLETTFEHDVVISQTISYIDDW